ncbi:Helix-turn-helix domain-containing protein [Halorientalis regularis]|jgi:DNA-binding HxlR family transcriptional regulator|uniref:Helix-turn-helix domain-containing protein n=2 Tax=Halorientalis regularis TaxID=660518 RepID=A0A1G7GKP6_9EURY|nr:Helix-turn-helix domain-containing protein [Halorientalis regularis]
MACFGRNTMTGDTRRYGTTDGVRSERETDDADTAGTVGTNPDELLELLGDEYTRAVLEAILDRPRSGGAVADEAGVSRATAFRRLNELAELGLVETEYHIDHDDGHHHKRYRAVIDTFSVTFGEEGFELAVDTDGTHARGRVPARAPADD